MATALTEKLREEGIYSPAIVRRCLRHLDDSTDNYVKGTPRYYIDLQQKIID